MVYTKEFAPCLCNRAKFPLFFRRQFHSNAYQSPRRCCQLPPSSLSRFPCFSIPVFFVTVISIQKKALLSQTVLKWQNPLQSKTSNPSKIAWPLQMEGKWVERLKCVELIDSVVLMEDWALADGDILVSLAALADCMTLKGNTQKELQRRRGRKLIHHYMRTVL